MSPFFRIARAVSFLAVLASVSTPVSCGGLSGRENPNETAGSSAGGATAGAAAAAGEGGTMTGVNPPGCPSVAPRAKGPCPAELSEMTCTYELPCGTGPLTFTYRCDRHWSLEPVPCEHPFEFCNGGDQEVICIDQLWTLSSTMDLPPPCPTAKPIPGDSCVYSQFSGPPSCGYHCDDGEGWTVGGCLGYLKPDVWVFDGACARDCSATDKALSDYAIDHRRCATDDDCMQFVSQCALTRTHCSGAFYFNREADMGTIAMLESTLADCAASASDVWTCSSCSEGPPEPVCREGRCKPGL